MNLKNLINEPGASLVDVRESWEFSAGSVAGSINIPLGQVFARLEEFKQMSKPLVLFCVSGNRSGMAEAFLKAQGVKEVYNGGAWQDVAYYKESAESVAH
jgi:phage shock protein E